MVPQSIELIELDVVDSTNTWLANQVRERVHGMGVLAPLAVMAHQQTQGRGRAGRQWEASADGSLCLSVGLEISLPVSPWFSIVVGVAVTRVLTGLGVDGLQLKWPNDLLLKGRKLGGVLCELVTAGPKQVLIVGLGLNLKNIHQPRALGGLGSSNLLQDSKTRIDLSKAELALLLASNIAHEVQQSQREGFAVWQSEFNRLDAWFGLQLEVVHADYTIRGQSRGCHSDGSYLIQDGNGLQLIQSGDLSLRKSVGDVMLMDAGNTRVKWIVARHSSSKFVDDSRQFFSTAELTKPEGFKQLAEQLAHTAAQYKCQEIWVCHVLGAGFWQQLSAALELMESGLTMRAPVIGKGKLLGSLYVNPASLGQDRWMGCLAGLTSPLQGVQVPLNCVVSFGTATTIDGVVRSDLLDVSWGGAAPSVHVGGVIIPGVELMQNSLHSNTAQLPKVQLQYEVWPTSTESAIASGIVRAQWSAVQSFVNDLEAQFGGPGKGLPPIQCRLWVHGGYAESLLPFVPTGLSAKIMPLQDAVFHGLMCSVMEGLA